MTGWIKLHRSITEWEWYQDNNTRAVFFHLILTANYEDKKWRGITIERGQRMCGRAQIAAELNISEQNVRTALKHLKLTNEVTIESTVKGTFITICNYDKYQEGNQQNNQQSNQQLTNHQPTANQQLTTTKEIKNIRNKEYIEVSKDTSFAEIPMKQEKIVFNFEDLEWENITDKQFNLWATAYPACDIAIELNKMAAWLDANPKQKKSNYARFIASWLMRSQQNGGTKTNQQQTKGFYHESSNYQANNTNNSSRRCESGASQFARVAALLDNIT